MATKWTSPVWRMPNEQNQSKLDNYSLDFDSASSQKITIPSYTITASATVSFFIKFDEASPNDIVIGGAVGNYFPNFYVPASGKILIYLGQTGSSSFVDTGIDFVSNTWYHVVVSQISGTATVYIDGISKGTATSKVPVITTIGAYTNSTLSINGGLSQVAIFDYALSETQVKYLYNDNDTVNPTVANPQNPMAIAGPTPIAYYPLGGSSTGSSSTLTIPNESGNGDTVFDFDGTSDFIEVPNSSSLQITDNLTLSCWINVNDVTTNNNILDKFYDGTTDGRSYLLRVQSSRIYLYLANASGTAAPDYISTSTLQNNTWYHITTTFSSTGEANKQVKIYINGSLDSEHAKTDLIASNDEEFRIGSSYNTSNRFAGKISNAQIWNGVITPSEVTTLYNGGRPYTGTQPQAANLKAWYKLNQSANWEADAVGEWQVPDAVSAYPQSFDFDTSHIEIGNVLNLGTTWTISFWINTTSSLTSNQAILSAGSGNGFTILLLRNSRLMLYRGAAADYNYFLANGEFNDGKWHNVTLVRNGTKDIIPYLDGNIGSYYFAAGSGNLDTNIKFIGDDVGTWSANPFNGELSNVQFWNTNLSGTEIETLYNNGSPLTTAIESSNLKAWYKLDNTATFSTNWSIPDTSGNGNTGTSSGMTEQNLVNNNVSTLNGASHGMTTANLVTSDLNRSLLYSSYSMGFDGTDDSITIPDSSSLNFSGNTTLSAWVYATAASSTFDMVITKNSTDNASIQFQLYLQYSNSSTKKIRFKASAESSPVSSTGTLSNNVWNHIALSINSGVTNGSVFYINGQPAGTATFSITANTEDVYIGDKSSNQYEFEGNINNVSVFNRALSENDILTIYNGGAPNDISSLSPVGWWSLSSDSYYNGNDWICPDLSGNNNNSLTSNGLDATDLVGNAPGSTANGTGTSMAIPTNLQGNAPNSDKNAYSVNMVATNRGTSVPSIP